MLARSQEREESVASDGKGPALLSFFYMKARFGKGKVDSGCNVACFDGESLVMVAVWGKSRQTSGDAA